MVMPMLPIALALALTPQPPSSGPARVAIAHARPFQATGGATATARVSVRILSAARFGSGYPVEVFKELGGHHRRTHVVDADGITHDAQLLEFE